MREKKSICMYVCVSININVNVCLFTFYTNPKIPATIIYRNITCCTRKKKQKQKTPENKCNEITTLLSALPFAHNNDGSSVLLLFTFPYRIHNQNKSFSPFKIGL